MYANVHGVRMQLHLSKVVYPICFSDYLVLLVRVAYQIILLTKSREGMNLCLFNRTSYDWENCNSANIQYSGVLMIIHDMRTTFPATVARRLNWINLIVITRGKIDRTASIFIVQSLANIDDCLPSSVILIRLLSSVIIQLTRLMILV